MKIQFKNGGAIYNTEITQEFIHEAVMKEFRKVCGITTFRNFKERSFNYYQVFINELTKISVLAKENNESYIIYMNDWFYEQLLSMQKETKRSMDDFYGIEFMFKSTRETHMKYVIEY